MTENVNVTSAILDKKTEYYGWNRKDYVAEGELTITITLEEYRDLVKSDATKQHDIDKANEDKYKRDSENKMLREEVEALRLKVYELQNNCIFAREVNINA